MDAHSACHQPWACALRRKNPVQGTLSFLLHRHLPLPLRSAGQVTGSAAAVTVPSANQRDAGLGGDADDDGLRTS
jgi:hypothetical protein